MLWLELSQHESRHQISGHTTGAVCWDNTPTLGKHLGNNVWQKSGRCPCWISIRFRQLYLVGLRERERPEEGGSGYLRLDPSIFLRKAEKVEPVQHKSTQRELFQAFVHVTPWGRVSRKIDVDHKQTRPECTLKVWVIMSHASFPLSYVCPGLELHAAVRDNCKMHPCSTSRVSFFWSNSTQSRLTHTNKQRCTRTCRVFFIYF